jgi:hypothetical protein
MSIQISILLLLVVLELDLQFNHDTGQCKTNSDVLDKLILDTITTNIFDA